MSLTKKQLYEQAAKNKSIKALIEKIKRREANNITYEVLRIELKDNQIITTEKELRGILEVTR